MEISKNRNGSRTVCVFKTHYREPGVGTIEVQLYQLDQDFGRYEVENLGDAEVKQFRLTPVCFATS